jgi:hypothetical protein
MSGSFGWMPFITVNAYNVWYLISFKSDWLGGNHDTIQFSGFSLRIISLIIFSAYVLLVMYQLSKKTNSETIVLAASSIAFAFFILPTQIHERYLFYFFPLFAMIALLNTRYLVIYIISTIVHLANLMMVLHYGGPQDSIFYPIQLILDGLIRIFSFNTIAIAIAVIHVILFVYLTKIGIGKEFIKNIKSDFLRIKSILKKGVNKIC